MECITSAEETFFRAFAELMIPSGPDPRSEPGAKEVGTINYVDSYLYDSSDETRRFFSESVEVIEHESHEKFMRSFAELSQIDKGIILRDLLGKPTLKKHVLFLRSLALDGFYSDYHDPSYGGVTPWEMMNFSGKRISDIKKDWSFLKVWRDSQASPKTEKE